MQQLSAAAAAISHHRAASAVSDGTARRGAAVECQLLQPARRSE